MTHRAPLMRVLAGETGMLARLWRFNFNVRTMSEKATPERLASSASTPLSFLSAAFGRLARLDEIAVVHAFIAHAEKEQDLRAAFHRRGGASSTLSALLERNNLRHYR